jgi:hypothetical protein
VHAYGTNSKERTAAIIKLVPVAVVGAIAGLLLLAKLSEVVGFSAPIWLQAVVGGPSATGALVGTYAWVDRKGWRKSWVRQLLGIQLPDLNGRWRVAGETSFVEPAVNPGCARESVKLLLAACLGKRRCRQPAFTPVMSPWEAEATIGQTWSELSVFLETRFSSSVSRSGSILINQDGGYSTLTYEYLNTPKPGARQAMQIHRGLVRLIVKEQAEVLTLDGDYYTHPRDRGNFGVMRLERVA